MLSKYLHLHFGLKLYLISSKVFFFFLISCHLKYQQLFNLYSKSTENK